MAEPKRNPAIGKHWLAYYALQGTEDLEFVREYISHAKGLIGDLSAGLRKPDCTETKEEVSGLFLFLIALDQAMAIDGQSEFKVEIKRRKAGKPINRLDRANAGHKAARMVEAAVQVGTPTEAAIADAVTGTGLSRSEIFSWLKHRRNIQNANTLREAEAEAARQEAGLPPLKTSG